MPRSVLMAALGLACFAVFSGSNALADEGMPESTPEVSVDATQLEVSDPGESSQLVVSQAAPAEGEVITERDFGLFGPKARDVVQSDGALKWVFTNFLGRETPNAQSRAMRVLGRQTNRFMDLGYKRADFIEIGRDVFDGAQREDWFELAQRGTAAAGVASGAPVWTGTALTNR